MLNKLSDARFRRQTYIESIRKLKGRVLEAGFGKGDTLTCFDSAQEVVCAEINPGRVMFGNAAVRESGLTNVRCIQASAESLPFPDHHFDAVCCSLVLCSVDDQLKTLQEWHRLLKPGGMLLAYEHTLHKKQAVRTIQHVLTPVLRPISGNCRMNNNPAELIEKAGFITEKTQAFPFWLEPRIMIMARKPY